MWNNKCDYHFIIVEMSKIPIQKIYILKYTPIMIFFDGFYIDGASQSLYALISFRQVLY